MTTKRNQAISLHIRDVQAEGITINICEGGDPDHPALLFLHGWPESKIAWKQVIVRLLPEMHVIAMDLPGIGKSVQLPRAYDKRTLASYIRGIIHSPWIIRCYTRRA